MATTQLPGSQPIVARAGDDRAQPPIRWPHPNRSSVLTIALWAIGLIVALAVPAFIVPPSQKTATVAAVWTSFSFTVVGAVIMIAATAWNFRRTKDSGILILGLVPGVTVIICGVILATVKVLGFV
jgi:hypothetical protein